MAAVSIDPESVAVETGNLHTLPRALAAETINTGYLIRLTDDGEAIHATAANTTADANVVGIALNSAEGGQSITYQDTGVIDLGTLAGMTVGRAYYLGESEGRIVPEADLTTGQRTTLIGVAETARLLRLHIIPTGIQRA